MTIDQMAFPFKHPRELEYATTCPKMVSCRVGDADEIVVVTKVKHRIRRTVRIGSGLDAKFTLNIGICRENGYKSHIPRRRLIIPWHPTVTIHKLL